jgi:hypothetical protein
VVVRLEVDLRSEVRQEDQQVTVQIAVERVGTASLTTRETVLKAGNVVAAQARVVTVRWDAAGHQAVPFADGHRPPAPAGPSRSRPSRPPGADSHGGTSVPPADFVHDRCHREPVTSASGQAAAGVAW